MEKPKSNWRTRDRSSKDTSDLRSHRIAIAERALSMSHEYVSDVGPAQTKEQVAGMIMRSAIMTAEAIMKYDEKALGIEGCIHLIVTVLNASASLAENVALAPIDTT